LTSVLPRIILDKYQGKLMKNSNRLFARAYKSRSAKLLNAPFHPSLIQTENVELKSDSRSVSDRIVSDRRTSEIHKEAHAIFSTHKSDQQSRLSQMSDASDSSAGGRILPCLLEIKASESLEAEDKSNLKALKIAAKSVKKLPRNKPALSTVNRPLRPVRAQYVEDFRSYAVSEEFANLSDLEILSMIERAHREIARRKDAGKVNLRAEIEAKLAKAGLDLGDLFPDTAKKGRKPGKATTGDGEKASIVKYKDHVSGDTWSGRGAHPPQWVKMIMTQRNWTVDQFKQSGEYDA